MKVLLFAVLSVIPLLSMDKPKKPKRRKHLSSRLKRRSKSSPENLKIDTRVRLHTAVRYGNGELFAKYLRAGDWINMTDEKHQTPLHLISDSFDLSAVEECFKEYTSTRIKEHNRLQLTPKDLKGRTPLHKACKRNNLQAVALLISLKAPLDIKDNKKRLPIELTSDLSIINYLLENESPITQEVTLRITSMYLKMKEKNKQEKEELKKKKKERMAPFTQFWQILRTRNTHKGV